MTREVLRDARIGLVDIGSAFVKTNEGPRIDPFVALGLIADRSEEVSRLLGPNPRYDLLCNDLPPQDAVLNMRGGTSAALAVTNTTALLNLGIIGQRLVVSSLAIGSEVLNHLRAGAADGLAFRQRLNLDVQGLIARFTLDMLEAIEAMDYTPD